MALHKQEGLYREELEKDSCGTGLIAQLNGHRSHELVEQALTMLKNMDHRGACGCEPNTGDGAGILLQNPHDFLAAECQALGFELPAFGEYGVGFLYLPKLESEYRVCKKLLVKDIEALNFKVLGFRVVPTNPQGLGQSALATEPRMEQIFVKYNDVVDRRVLERKLYRLRKFCIHHIHSLHPEWIDLFYVCSWSYKTIVYKGQLTTYQLDYYFPDLHDQRLTSAIAIIHSRFSTNTFPKWKLAQPFRYIAHNGEINTITGNLNWWKAREPLLKPDVFTSTELEDILPICYPGLSDSGSFDNVLEFLFLSGRSFPHALMMMIPEAWQHDEQMPEFKKAFYEYHDCLMEPWDGPAAICFSDGIVVGATLDRNGLRPARYCLLEDNTLIVASEAGVLPVDQSKILLKGRLQPGKMLIADLDQHRIIGDEELKSIVCSNRTYGKFLQENKVYLTNLSSPNEIPDHHYNLPLLVREKMFGFTREDFKYIITPMCTGADEPVGSMGNDTPLAILSHQPQHLANYFKQLFAQVTNPPIDPIREKTVMSLNSHLGSTGNILSASPENCRQIHLEQPVLNAIEFNKIISLKNVDFRIGEISLLVPGDFQPTMMSQFIKEICYRAEELVLGGHNILWLSDRQADKQHMPLPSLLVIGAIHHHLIKEGLRLKTSLLLEAGDIRESHHYATLIGYGADAIYPYLVYESINGLWSEGAFDTSYPEEKYQENYRKAIQKGLLKIISKNGISTLKSYKGAQIFEILGLSEEVVELCFKGTVSRIAGLSLDEIGRECQERHREAFYTDHELLKSGGVYQWKRDGEYHHFNPQTIHLLQYSTRRNDYNLFKKYSQLMNDQGKQACFLRGLLDFTSGEPIAIEEVEPIQSILKRFSTGAMSFGSISHEAHSTLAIAMNRIGAKSNSGEGGEDYQRFKRKSNGDWERSAVKQVASGRFGVTSYYLANADELQIKMAQGAKPGEGGQLPGHKVDEWIARTRHSTPGVGLISPPPHHDIYSIEDLAQLIFDLKNSNRHARISVKLVSKAGVGVIASGVAKAHADVIMISGHDGGTGASPWTSIKHAGLPWELGVAEAHQTLVRNKLRDRVVLQTDGQLRTGKDLAVAALLGAEEWSVATAALVVEGCIMMRKCHLNTCPVGIATQDPRLRERFAGDPDHVVNFFTFLATELREIMAQLGFRTVNEMIGRVDKLKFAPSPDYWKHKTVDLSELLFPASADAPTGRYKSVNQDHGIDNVLDWYLLERATVALKNGGSISSEIPIRNTDRAVGTLLSHEISKKMGEQGLKEDSIEFRFRGSAGQSFGAFATRGLKFILEGEANDYFGKGLSGGKLIVSHDRAAKFDPSDNIIIGNVAFYGATSGEAYIKGMAGERFCVRNSGAKVVVEGVGDHGCEYMTGGRVVVLGKTGDNFAAGMSGGIAYVYDRDQKFMQTCNIESVDLEHLSVEDEMELKFLIRNHGWYTSSRKAFSLLENWSEEMKHFIKVMPKDYKRVLLQNQEKAALESIIK